MQWVDTVVDYVKNFNIHWANMDWSDVLEILVIAVVVYYILVWLKATRAWSFLKGLIVICGFLVIAAALKMNNILWIVQHMLGFAAVGLVVILQPELRNALEELGNKKFISPILTSQKEQEVFSEKIINEIIKACMEMGRARTGALIVIERQISLKEYVRTGIEVDGLVSSQLLINIFEHNTPLHDGAVIIRGNRIASATCYLPLSDDLSINKELGTRHRAGKGISEVSDSLTLIVSEETGKISTAFEGELKRNLNADGLKAYMHQVLNNKGDNTKSKRKRRGGRRSKDEKENIS